jgi:myo-inositol 2-dehydrogenase/D-chiro-inositol 1-dehydrogenase
MGGNHAGSWNGRDDAEVVAVFDPDADRCGTLAGKMNATACASMEEAIVQTEVDIVSVAAPIAFHAEASCMAMEHGRHVFCEKAIALTLADADRMIQTAQKNDVKLCIGHQHRTAGHYAAFKKLFDEDVFGGPTFVRLLDVREVRPKLDMHRKSRNGGPVIDMGSHFFDLMRYFTGEEAGRVFARGHVFGRGKERLAGIDDLAIDAAEITVEFTGGHVLSVYLNWGMPEGFKGGGRAEVVSPLLWARQGEEEVEAVYADRTETVKASAADPGGIPGLLESLVKAIETGSEVGVTGYDGRQSLAMALAAIQSIETGEAVPVG